MTTNNTNQTATKLETEVLIAIYFDQYHDGREPINDEVWSSELDTNVRGKQLSGVMSQLVQKGFAGSNDYNKNEKTCWITQQGYDAIKDSEEFKSLKQKLG